LLTVLLGTVAILIRPERYGIPAIAFYTIQSNLIGLLSSLMFLIGTLRKKELPFVRNMRFCACITLFVTFLIVIFVLVWFTDPLVLLFDRNNLFHHILIPIMTLVSYIYFEPHADDVNTIRFPVIYSILYSIVMVILNILGIVDGPYPFFMVRRFGLPIVVLSCFGIGIVLYVICRLVKAFALKTERRRKDG